VSDAPATDAQAEPVAAPTLDPRRQAQLARWQQRSRRVHFFRRALPVVIGVVVLALAGWILLRALLGAIGDKGGEAIHMLNPRYYGRDEQGRAFVVAAKEAVRDGKDVKQVKLIAPGFAMETGRPGRPMQIKAADGLYREHEQILTLSGGVKMQDGRGYDLDTASARIDPRAGTVTGDSAITGQGPLGRIAASSYAVYDRGARVVFKGKVRAHIEPRR
jgi:lipopolysaccharide export system protein LptC